MSNELQKGSTVFIRYNGFDKRQKSEPMELEVTKVGSKYFYCQFGYREYKFSFETMLEQTEKNYGKRAYLTMQEILDEDEHRRLSEFVNKSFSGYGKSRYSLDILRQVKELIEPKQITP